MKKICALIIMILSIASLHAFTVPTSRGDVEVVVPEGYTLEEAYIEISRLYLEERWDHEELIEESSKLVAQLDTYVEENKKLRNQYNILFNSYQKIDELYAELTKVDFFNAVVLGDVSYDFNHKSLGVSVGGGVCFNEVLDINASLQTGFNLQQPSSNPNLKMPLLFNLNLRYEFD